VPDSPVGFEAVGGVNTIGLGVLKFARFSRLKISARNYSCSRSLIAVSFNTEKSHVASPGPMNVSRPALPYKPLAEGGAINAAGLNHWLGFPNTSGPGKLGFTNRRTALRVSPLFDGL
jgi:hypothetical protein